MKLQYKAALGIIVLAVCAIGGWWAWDNYGPKKSEEKFRTAKVEKGPITATVSATGTLNPVVSVSVGSQVSGQIKELFVDFNSEVKKGQLIARIDPEIYEYRVRQSQADLDASRAGVSTAQANIAAQRAEVARSEVTLADAKRDFERKTALVEKNFIAASEKDKAEATFKAAQATLASAKAQQGVSESQAKNAQAVVAQRDAQLAQAKVDLERTAIRSPVDGVVVKRSIEPGQTVAASLQAPELFVIAQNLADMQVEASIDESDVGRIRVGQTATFTVDSFAGRSFSGAIKQVRKAAQTVQNVVTYTVVITAANPELNLLPGMTANVRITTDKRDSVLKVANSALRFRPPGAVEDNPTTASAQNAPTAGVSGGAAVQNPSPSASSGGSPGGSTAGPGGGRGPGAGQRERLIAELKLNPEQTAKVNEIFDSMREKFMALREASEAERPRIVERNRAEIRERITAILTDEQKKRYLELQAEQSGRAPPSRGRVWITAEDGKPKLVTLRLGLTDGTSTEVVSGDLKEGQEILIGVAQAPGKGAAPAAPANRPTGPRLPF
jgi:HlyD family secretion protein